MFGISALLHIRYTVLFYFILLINLLINPQYFFYSLFMLCNFQNNYCIFGPFPNITIIFGVCLNLFCPTVLCLILFVAYFSKYYLSGFFIFLDKTCLLAAMLFYIKVDQSMLFIDYSVLMYRMLRNVFGMSSTP